MATRFRDGLRAAVLCGALVPVLASAQNDRITLRFQPRPEQILHTRTTMQMSMPTDASGHRPAVDVTTSVAFTTVYGRQDEHGHYDGEMVIEEVTVNGTVGGRPIPTPAVQVPIVGRRFGVTFDSSGDLVDVRSFGGDPGAPPAAQVEALVRQMMEQANRTIPIGATIGIGETIERPLDFPLPAGAGAPPATLHMKMALTLKSIDHDGPERIARFDQVMSASASTGADPLVPMDMQGGGTMEWNVDRGFARAGTGEFTVGFPGAPVGPMQMKLRVTMTASE